LGQNLGYQASGVFGTRQSGLVEAQQRAWDYARQALDKGQPCYGWELEVPEYYVICGYDEVGYHYSGPGCDDGRGPKAWQELGDTGIGIVEVCSVRPSEKAPDRTIVREALATALKFARDPGDWTHPGYQSGLAAYDAWNQALEQGAATAIGMSYNAAVWRACRRHAVEFLQEARERVGSGIEELFDRALAYYQAVSDHLQAVVDIYPFTTEEHLIPIDDNGRAAVAVLSQAKEAEASGLNALAAIADALGGADL
jgi:hypothetical protein